MLGKTSFNYLLDVEQPDRVKLTVRPFTPGWTAKCKTTETSPEIGGQAGWAGVCWAGVRVMYLSVQL